MKKQPGRRPIEESVAFLIESDLERAELILSAKSITDSLQKMAEQLARVEANDLMPVLDPMRAAFGPQAADQFNKIVTEKTRGLIEAIKGAKEAIGIEISRLEGSMNGKAPNDMALEPTPSEAPGDGDMGGGMDAEMGDDNDMDAALGTEAGGGNMADPMKGGDDGGDDPFADLFKDDGAQQGNAAGRAKKESFTRRGQPVIEVGGRPLPSLRSPLMDSSNPDATVLRRFRHLLGEGMSPATAAKRTADAYAIDITDVVQIVQEAKKKKKDDPCWKGYKQIGMKKKGGKEVPNCVPESAGKSIRESAEVDPTDILNKAGIPAYWSHDVVMVDHEHRARAEAVLRKNMRGAMPKIMTEAKGKKPDKDGDGVPDWADKKKGKDDKPKKAHKPDSDKDGIPNWADKKPMHKGGKADRKVDEGSRAEDGRAARPFR